MTSLEALGNTASSCLSLQGVYVVCAEGIPFWGSVDSASSAGNQYLMFLQSLEITTLESLEILLEYLLIVPVPNPASAVSKSQERKGRRGAAEAQP